MTRFLSPILAGFRSLRAKPGYALTCVLILGVSSATLFTVSAVVDALLMRPPSARNPAELLFIKGALYGGVLSHPDFVDLRERNTMFEELFAYDWPIRVGLDIDTRHRDVRSEAVSGTLFPTLGVIPTRGRLFTPADDVLGAEPVIVVSDALQRSLQLEPGALVQINKRPFRVIGTVAADHIDLARSRRPDVWIPLAQVSAYRPEWMLNNRNSQWLNIGGRLKPGATREEVDAELTVLAQRFQSEWPDFYSKLKLSSVTFPALRLGQDARARTMLLLGGTIAALFALACTNFFAITLLRLLSRRREIAVRVAIGATRGTIARWIFGELSAVLVLGLAAGAGISWCMFRLMQLDPRIRDLLEGASVRPDGRAAFLVAAFAVAALGIIWIMLSREVGREDVSTAIKESATAPGRHRSFGALLAMQLMVALFLLAMSAAFLSTLRDAVNRSPTFHTERVVMLDADIRPLGVASDRAGEHRFWNNMIDTLARLPGVTAVGGATSQPLWRARGTHTILDSDEGRENPEHAAMFTFTSPGYFDALGVRFRQGHSISETEFRSNQPVGVINRAMATRFWPGEATAVGQTFRPWAGGPRTVVVGVVDDIPTGISGDPSPHFYLPFTSSDVSALQLVIGVRDDSEASRQQVARAVAALWPNSSPPEPYPIAQHIRESRSDLLSSTRVILWVALFATAITAFGLYSFSAFTAAQTIRDSAVRVALGASFGQIVRAHLLRYRWGFTGGFAGGLALVFASGPVLRRLDVSLQPLNAATVLVAGCVLAVIAVIGLCVPLRRIRHVDIRATLTTE
ncbi:MAG TPA: ABC transporter permease [Opitutaceae bacterium]|nr:ABC transporter permease [Opitutaceae bacterium]